LGSTEKILTQNKPASSAAFIGTKKRQSLNINDFTIENANCNGHSSHTSSKDILKKAQKGLIDANIAASLLYMLVLFTTGFNIDNT
jgi:hypothetical protein